MARRNDTSRIGDAAEQEVENLLSEHGWIVKNLNERKRNNPTYDLVASKGSSEIFVSVKAARAKRHLRLGHPHSLSRVSDDSFIFALIPQKKGEELDIDSRKYELWIIPGHAREDALRVHNHYHRANPEKAFERGQTIMLKDKVDREGGRSISGSAFQRWRELYKDAWHILPMEDAQKVANQ